MKKATREWIQKAEADYRSAEKLRRDDDALHDQGCFFSQQSAEKYLKSLLEELGEPIPWTHRLQDLLALLCRITHRSGACGEIWYSFHGLPSPHATQEIMRPNERC